MELKIEYLDVNALKPYQKNARKHEEYDISQIAKSIEKYGFNDPIGVWSDKNIIVEGHGRYEAAKFLKLSKVPVIHLDNLTDEERKEYAIMHNKTAELSVWDYDKLSEELNNMNFLDFDIDFGLPTVISDDMLEDFFETATKPVEPTEKGQSSSEADAPTPVSKTSVSESSTSSETKKLYTVKCPHCGELITLTENFDIVEN